MIRLSLIRPDQFLKSLAARLHSFLRQPRRAESLGGAETLLTYPIIQTHMDVPEETKKLLGLNDCLLRLSVGLERAEDLLSDLTEASRV